MRCSSAAAAQLHAIAIHLLHCTMAINRHAVSSLAWLPPCNVQLVDTVALVQHRELCQLGHLHFLGSANCQLASCNEAHCASGPLASDTQGPQLALRNCLYSEP